MPGSSGSKKRIRLRYFDEVLAVELGEIAHRRRLRSGKPRCDRVQSNPPLREPLAPRPKSRQALDPDLLFRRAEAVTEQLDRGEQPYLEPEADAQNPDIARQRPLPLPLDTKGLALSGGGVRSAAIGFGVLQALAAKGRLGSFDYLSTVSGGGYIGATLTAGLAKSPDESASRSLFAGMADNLTVAHLRDYSNYLLPRDRSALRNWTDVIAIVFRGLVANGVVVSAILLLFALITVFAYPTIADLLSGSFVARLVERITGGRVSFASIGGDRPFSLTTALFLLLALILFAWALVRSRSIRARSRGDADSPTLQYSGWLVGVVAALAVLDLQPVAIHALATVLDHDRVARTQEYPIVGAIERLLAWAFGPFVNVRNLGGGASFAGAAAALSALGQILRPILAQTSKATGWAASGLRYFLNTIVVVLAGIVAPLLLWGAYLYLSFALIKLNEDMSLPIWTAVLALFVLGGCALTLDGNAYSLLRFYRDRLSSAFVFWVNPDPVPQVKPLDDLKLSELKPSLGPYPIINSALNVEGSKDANKRGRNADFFMFTPYFVGSDLTLYAPTADEPDGTRGMESVDRGLDLPTAMAISGAAVSSNMGSNTRRVLSPTLALLNVRLGYWLRNPRALAQDLSAVGPDKRAWRFLSSRFYLLAESAGLLDESSALIYLTDGGHIENLGIYELLKRGCKLIVVVDAEADPDMTFSSLQIVERYARIDFGVRLNLPWEQIATKALATDQALAGGTLTASAGPHCAVGRILYPDGAHGVIAYFKASMTGDEPDYVLGYKKRNPSFPQETTAEQFFTEEQFEVYRALGFHMVDHFFDRADEFCWLDKGEGAFATLQDAFAAVDAELSEELA